MQKGNKSLAYSNIQAFKHSSIQVFKHSSIYTFKLKHKVPEAELKEFEPLH